MTLRQHFPKTKHHFLKLVSHRGWAVLSQHAWGVMITDAIITLKIILEKKIIPDIEIYFLRNLHNCPEIDT